MVWAKLAVPIVAHDLNHSVNSGWETLYKAARTSSSGCGTVSFGRHRRWDNTLTKVKACPQAKYTLRTLAEDNTAEKRRWCWRWGRDSLSPAAHRDYDVESKEALRRCAS